MCLFLYVFTRLHVCLRVAVCGCEWVLACLCRYVYAHVWVLVLTCVHIFVHTCGCTCLCACLVLYVCVYVRLWFARVFVSLYRYVCLSVGLCVVTSAFNCAFVRGYVSLCMLTCVSKRARVVRLRVYVSVLGFAHMSLRVSVFSCLSACAWMFARVCMWMCLCVCMFERERERERERAVCLCVWYLVSVTL